MATTLISGAAFGAAMAAAGFHDPGVIISQLKLEDWHMVQVFLTATATSAAIYALAQALGTTAIPPRASSPLALFSPHDGNLLGGALLGAGMALAGSCPGALYVQLAAGAPTARYTLLGGLLGGILWSGPVRRAVRRRQDAHAVKPQTGTLSAGLGLSPTATVLLLDSICWGGVLAATRAASSHGAPEKLVPGIVGGLLIGGAQLVSLLARGSLLGMSGSYEEMGAFFWWFVGGGAKPPSYANMLFAGAVTAGAWGLLSWAPAAAPAAHGVHASPVLAAAGGVLMALGSRMAGGCTSGHGISGISLLSVSSVVTMGAAFAAGGVVAALVY